MASLLILITLTCSFASAAGSETIKVATGVEETATENQEQSGTLLVPQWDDLSRIQFYDVSFDPAKPFKSTPHIIATAHYVSQYLTGLLT